MLVDAPTLSVPDTVRAAFFDTLDAHGVVMDEDLTDETVLLDCGLDSLGYAELVVRLEDELGYDPFALMAEPVYPRTYGEFADVYARYARHADPR